MWCRTAVSFSPGFLFTNCRIRSAPGDTAPRLCVRPCPCVADSPRPRPFAPAAPPGIAPPCSPPSSLLWPRQTAARRASSAPVASLPDAVPAYDPPGRRAALPGPGVGRACVREFFDTAEPGDGSPCGAVTGVAFDHTNSLGTPNCPFRCSIAPPAYPATDASRVASRRPAHGSRSGMEWLVPLPQRTSTSCPSTS